MKTNIQKKKSSYDIEILDNHGKNFYNIFINIRTNADEKEILKIIEDGIADHLGWRN